MNREERMEIMKKREYLVVKGNDLIQKNRFELSLVEQKTVAFICSMIKPEEGGTFELEYDFSINDYCKTCGLSFSGNNYAEIKETLRKLRNRSMWLQTETEEILVGWLAKVTLVKKSGVVKIKIDEDLAPYLFNLGQQFTQYQLGNILAMKSAFSVRMYELLKSYSFRKSVTFELAELKRLLCVEKIKTYDRYPDFRRKVLEMAEREINELSDLNISYEAKKKGNRVEKITFHIQKKMPIEELIAIETGNEKLARKSRKLTKKEREEYDRMTENAEQITLFD